MVVPTMFHTVLVANRGEIAVRVMRTLRSLRITSVAVYSDADADARHVAEADLAVRIGPAAARESYLSSDAILAAALASGAEAIHPGYGFLSENAEFARACAAAGVVLIGPTPEAMEVMGDKIAAKRAAVAAGVPVVPGAFDDAMSDADLAVAAAAVGYPVLIKPAAGGGGKGMRLVRDPATLAEDLVSARRESLAAFGDDTLFVERFVTRPRHIEIQVLADSHGAVVHLGERECSLQRRHQKIVEEAPSVLLDPQTRQRIGTSAVELARAVGYVGAGTVEFIVSTDRPEEFFFLEMNTRLQVEHPVTELVTGLDLVEAQIRVAAGEPLSLTQADVQPHGHAIEARVYAEDPSRGFLPTGGTVVALREPVGEQVRVDSGIRLGTEVGSSYDPMLAKVIVWGADRATALDRLRVSLRDTVILGVATNLEFLQRLLADDDVVAGRLDTELVDRELPRLLEAPAGVEPDEELLAALAAYAMIRLLALQPKTSVPDPWELPTGWRIGEPRPLVLRPRLPGPGEAVEVRIWGSPDRARVSVAGGPSRPAALTAGEPGELMLMLNGLTRRWSYADDGDQVWLHHAGRTLTIREAPAPLRLRADAEHDTQVRSPMPGVVLAIATPAGTAVVPGQPLVVVEAMKMEHTIVATSAGRVSEVLVRVGEQVSLDQPLAVLHQGEPEVRTP